MSKYHIDTEITEPLFTSQVFLGLGEEILGPRPNPRIFQKTRLLLRYFRGISRPIPGLPDPLSHLLWYSHTRGYPRVFIRGNKGDEATATADAGGGDGGGERRRRRRGKIEQITTAPTRSSSGDWSPSLDLSRIDQIIRRSFGSQGFLVPAVEPVLESSVSRVENRSLKDKERWWKKGLRAISEGKLAVVLLAGGQGTRLGSFDPKGCFSKLIPPEFLICKMKSEDKGRKAESYSCLDVRQ